MASTATPRLQALAIGLVLAVYQWGASAQPASPVAPAQVCVTNGEISKQDDKSFAIESPSSRAVVKSSDDNFGAIEFQYLGPTSKDAPLASGRLVRQLGLKLHARDSCNVIYVMWNTDPDVGLQVSTKVNPKKSTHAECGVKGYKMVYQSKPGDIPAIRIGETRRLEAALKERTLTVKIDDKDIWQGELAEDAVKSTGYSGIRTDNVRVRFIKWLAAPADKASKAVAPEVNCRPVVARTSAGS
jgi:hypothetical protein